MSYAKPLPVVDTLHEPFWALARANQFGVQVCRSCSHAHFPGSPVCPNCMSADQHWVAGSGRGTLQSWCTFHRAYWTAFEADLPYTVGLIRLEEGPLIACTLIDFDESTLRLDLPVEAVFEPVTDAVTLAKFRPVV